MRWLGLGVVALTLAGCGQAREGGTAVGNPGRAAVRLAPDDGVPWVDPSVEEVALTVTPCDGDAPRTVRLVGDLAADAIDLPLGAACRVEVVVHGLEASSPRALGPVDARFELALPELVLDGEPWVLELGQPGDPEALAAAGWFYDVGGDGLLDVRERARGPEAAGEGRAPSDAVAIVAVGDDAWRGVFGGEGLGPSLVAEAPGGELTGVDCVDLSCVAVGPSGVFRSADLGGSWSLLEAPRGGLGVAGDAEGFWVVDLDGTVWASEGDGFAPADLGAGWRGASETTAGLVLFGEGKVMVGRDGAVESLGDGPAVNDVAAGPPGLVAVGDDGARWFRPTGGSWDLVEIGGEPFHAVVWTGQTFLAVGDRLASASAEGSSSSWADGVDKWLSDLVVVDGALVGVTGEFLFRSADHGLSWDYLDQTGDPEIDGDGVWLRGLTVADSPAD